MPKIAAPTVREHHDMIKARLIEAAERILQERGPQALSAGAVAKEAGIARNSIYRYVDSVDDLKMLALESFVPRWGKTIFSQINMSADPAERLADFAVASVLQTRNYPHSSLMSAMRLSTGRPGKSAERATAQSNVAHVHGFIEGFITQQFQSMEAENPDLWASFVRALIFESFKASEAKHDVEAVSHALRTAILALCESARTIPFGEVQDEDENEQPVIT